MLQVRELSDKTFDRFREIIYRESGIKMSPMKKSLVQSRLMRRMRELSLPDYEDYYAYLVENYSSELFDFINCITTNKTEFFRESAHFDFLTNEYLPAVTKERKELRIWCAGCSTGEEAYSIAITILEYSLRIPLCPVRILATDIDTKVLDTARGGVYPDAALSQMKKDFAKRYFLKGSGVNNGKVMVKENVRKMISFARLNFLDENYPMKKKFDVIFCRNVVIYFDRDTQKSLFKKFYNYLDKDGYLLIGHSETLTGLQDIFRCYGKSIYVRID